METNKFANAKKELEKVGLNVIKTVIYNANELFKILRFFQKWTAIHENLTGKNKQT